MRHHKIPTKIERLEAPATPGTVADAAFRPGGIAISKFGVAYDEHATNGVCRSSLLARAEEIMLARQKRVEIFGQGMFREHAWDMLIILYVASVKQRLTIGRLVALARAPMTTALRWLEYLETQRLVERESHPTDRRAFFVDLTDRGRAMLDLYLYETLS